MRDDADSSATYWEFDTFTLRMMLIVTFVIGFFLGILCLESENSYVQVLKSYVRLHWWNRLQAQQLTDLAQKFGLQMSFAYSTEQTALATTVVALAGYSLGRRQPALQA